MNAQEIKNKADALLKRVYRSSQSQPMPDVFVLLGENGLLDSISILELVVGIEREFGIHIFSEDICPENFRDPESLVQFISRKLSGDSTTN